MSNIVWSADKGWHDGPGVVVSLDSRGRLRITPCDPCPNHPGQWRDKATGVCSCGSNHNRWASSNNPGGQS